MQRSSWASELTNVWLSSVVFSSLSEDTKLRLRTQKKLVRTVKRQNFSLLQMKLKCLPKRWIWSLILPRFKPLTPLSKSELCRVSIRQNRIRGDLQTTSMTTSSSWREVKYWTESKTWINSPGWLANFRIHTATNLKNSRYLVILKLALAKTGLQTDRLKQEWTMMLTQTMKLWSKHFTHVQEISTMLATSKGC